MRPDPDDKLRVRLDKWLWAARFFKTRAQASEAVQGGKVHVDGRRVKPSYVVKPDDEIEIARHFPPLTVRVTGISDKRGAAVVAQTLYQELEESLARREQHQTQRKQLKALHAVPKHKPNKRERRQLLRWQRGGDS